MNLNLYPGIKIILLLINLFLLLFAVAIHEFAHGWIANRCGDPTAKLSGRLSLNPLKHIDPLMTIILPLLLFFSTQGRFVFGAAKPVPVNFSRLNNPKRDIIWVGLSGPAANFIFAFIVTLLLKITPFLILQGILYQLITINIFLGVFNLVPIPPLDGSRIVMGLLPRPLAANYARIEPYGFIIIMGLFFLGSFNYIIEPAITIVLQLLLSI